MQKIIFLPGHACCPRSWFAYDAGFASHAARVIAERYIINPGPHRDAARADNDMSGLRDSLTCSLLSNDPAVKRLARNADIGIVPCDPRESLVIAIDTLVEGTHYRAGAGAKDVAWKALAVNLSDLAAMGADAKTAAVSLSLPASRQGWLESFRRGLESAAGNFSVEVIAATVITGPGIVTVEACGGVPHGLELTRRGACAGDAVYVTGTLGDAGLGLEIVRGNLRVPSADAEFLTARLDRPTPRLAAGRALRRIASAAIDVSDGLAGDLGHMLSASGVGATVDVDKLPRSAQLRNNAGEADGRRLATSAGDDYELCFTVPQRRQSALEAARHALEVDFTRIGVIESRPGLRFVFGNGDPFDAGAAFDHFA